MPRLLLEILQNASKGRMNLELNSLEGSPAEVVLAIAEWHPDVLVIGTVREGEVDLAALTEECPGLQVVTISPDGRRVSMHRPRLPPLTVEGTTPEELLTLICCVADPGTEDPFT
jgi:hypothetical protein